MNDKNKRIDRLSVNQCSQALAQVFSALKKEQDISQKRIKELVPFSHSTVNLSKISSYKAYPSACRKHSRAYLKAIVQHFRLDLSWEAGELDISIPPVQAAYHYLYYYWNRYDQLKRALLEISETGKEAQLGFFESQGPLLRYQKGKVRHTEHNIFIQFSDEKTESFIVLYKPQSDFPKERFLMGTYSAARLADKAPIAGAILLEQQPDFETAKQQLAQQVDLSVFTRALRWAHIETPTEQLFQVPEETLPSINAQNWERMCAELADAVVQRMHKGLPPGQTQPKDAKMEFRL